MLLLLAALFSSLRICSALFCYRCGAFLSAPSPHCLGIPKNISCGPDHYGCLTISGERGDGTFYVEKRCADKHDDHSVGCKTAVIQGMKIQQCFCEGDLCNNSNLGYAPVVLLMGAIFMYAVIELMDGDYSYFLKHRTTDSFLN